MNDMSDQTGCFGHLRKTLDFDFTIYEIKENIESDYAKTIRFYDAFGN